MDLDLLTASLATALLAASPALIAATGELIAETVGVYNLGIEGAMLSGALAGFVATNETGTLLLGLLLALAVGAAAASIVAIAVIVFDADMVVAGLAVTFLSIGLTGWLGAGYVRETAAETVPIWNLPVLSDIPYLGEALFRQPVLVYLAVLCPIVVWLILTRTRLGLNLRAIGESPHAADVSGVSVNVTRAACVAIGGAFAGLGGALLSLGSVGSWLPNITNGEGYIALAIVIFASWRALPLIAGALLFGALGTLGNVAQALGWSVSADFFFALPYLGTLAVVAVLAWLRTRRAARPPWPAALGETFQRSAA
ncbi:MAG: ABC transporter permease [Thermoleophilaceae bacterium]